jgi:hypothetical protein
MTVGTTMTNFRTPVAQQNPIPLLHLIRHVQHGFRHNHSTSTQLLTVIDDVVNNFNKRIMSVAALLDVEKAFDKVWNNGLIFKLSALNLPVQLINKIKYFLSNRSFYIKVDNQFSTDKPIQAGVPQGSKTKTTQSIGLPPLNTSVST